MSRPTMIHKIFETNSSFDVKIMHFGKNSISIFHVQEIFASADSIFISGGGLRAG